MEKKKEKLNNIFNLSNFEIIGVDEKKQATYGLNKYESDKKGILSLLNSIALFLILLCVVFWL